MFWIVEIRGVFFSGDASYTCSRTPRLTLPALHHGTCSPLPRHHSREHAPWCKSDDVALFSEISAKFRRNFAEISTKFRRNFPPHKNCHVITLTRPVWHHDHVVPLPRHHWGAGILHHGVIQEVSKGGTGASIWCIPRKKKSPDFDVSEHA